MKTLNLIYVSRPTISKGLGDLLSALSLIDERHWSLKVIVSKPFFLKEFGAHKSEKIELLGNMPNTLVCEHMCAADVLVIPSHYENFGNVALEGMAAGCVLVTTNVGGLQEIVTSNGAGFLYPPKDIQKLSKIISMLVENPQILNVLQANNKDKIINYSWEKILTKTEHFIGKVRNEYTLPVCAS